MSPDGSKPHCCLEIQQGTNLKIIPFQCMVVFALYIPQADELFCILQIIMQFLKQSVSMMLHFEYSNIEGLIILCSVLFNGNCNS